MASTLESVGPKLLFSMTLVKLQKKHDAIRESTSINAYYQSQRSNKWLETASSDYSSTLPLFFSLSFGEWYPGPPQTVYRPPHVMPKPFPVSLHVSLFLFRYSVSS